MKLKSLLLIIMIGISLFAQVKDSYMPDPKYPELFKAIVPIENDAPAWIHELYSDNPNLFELEKNYQKYFKTEKFVKTLHTQNYKHLMRRIYQNIWYNDQGEIIVRKTKSGEIKHEISKDSQSDQASWVSIGPHETYSNGGEQTESTQANVYAITQSLSNPNVLYSITETRGVYKSIDKGGNWTGLGESFFNEPMLSIEVDPTNENIVFLGTNDRIYRSTDGGITWTSTLNVSSMRIYEFAINPSNNQEVFAAGHKGLYKSTDGGSQWTQVFTDTCWDVKHKTDDSNKIFLLKSNSNAKRTEFFVSEDATNFTLKDNGWFTATTSSTIGGARMALTNADGNRVYVLMLGNVESYTTDLNFIGLYRSDNAGEMWSLPYDHNNDGQPNNNPGGPYSNTHWSFSSLGNAGGTYDQGFYNVAIDVSDQDPDKLLMGMLNLFKSEDGGKTYTNWGGYLCSDCTPYPRHPDHQDILINGTDAFVTTDGGVDYYNGETLVIIKAINKGINATENWGFDQGWNEDVLTAGRYHNGNGAYHSNFGDGKFIFLGGAESPTGYVNRANNFVVYHSDITARKINSDFNTKAVNSINIALFPNESIYVDDKSEIAYDPRYNNHLYLGKENKLWKSTDNGLSFNLVKSFGTNTSNKVRGIEVSRIDPNIIFIAQQDGTSQSKLFRSENGGETWMELTLPNNRKRLYISFNEKNTLFITFGTSSNKVFKSIDLGNTWESLNTPTIENLFIKGISAQLGTNDGVYIITSQYPKVFYRNATHTDWQPYGEGLPHAINCSGIKPFYKKGELRMSSNRGFWTTPLFEPSSLVAQPMVSQENVKCHRKEIDFDDFSVINHTNASWEWEFPGAHTISSTTIRNPKVTYNEIGSYDVKLTITDSNGSEGSKTIENMIKVQESECTERQDEILNCLEISDNSQIINSDELDFGSSNTITFTGWIKPQGIQNTYSAILFVGNSPLEGLALGFSGNNQLYFQWYYDHWGLSTGLHADANKWNYVAVRVTPDKATLFLNDKKWELENTFNPIQVDKITLGRDYDVYKGQMEEFKIWNRALSDEEIYLKRHLIEDEIDNDLIAYYQFNNTESSTMLYDKAKGSDLHISSSIMFKPSTAPVAKGVSQIKIIESQGIYDFPTSSASLTFNTNSMPNGKVVVSKLNTTPIEPDQINVLGDEYWILDNYGLNTTFTGLSLLKLNSSHGNLGSNLGNITFHKRHSNDYLATGWVEESTADNIIGNQITLNGENINKSLQIVLDGESTLGTGDTQSAYSKHQVYPNPYSKESVLNIDGLENKPFQFTLYSQSGKILYQENHTTNQMKIDKEIPSGLYFYRIETSNKLFTGKLYIK